MIALLALGVAVAQLPNNALIGTTTYDTCSPSNVTACFDGGCASTGCVLSEPQCDSGYQHTLQMITLTANECTAHTWTWRCAAETTTTVTTTTATTTVTTTTPTTTATTTPKLLKTTNDSDKGKLAWYWIVVIALAAFIVLGCMCIACVVKSQNRRTHAMG